MVVLNFILVILLTVFMSESQNESIFKPEALEEFEEICRNVTQNPYFSHKKLVGKTWRVYYGWNIKLDEECTEISYKYANDYIINRIWTNMHGFLKTQPPWPKAVLLMTFSQSREMLLFDDESEVPGEFIGVHNIRQQKLEDMYKHENTAVALYKITKKLLRGGTYLLISDCQVGVTTLSVQESSNKPKRAAIEAVASTLNFGDGFPACIEPDTS